MLEAVINVSEGRDNDLIDTIGDAAGDALLDIHRDTWHNRSVFSLASPDVVAVALELTHVALLGLDFSRHQGVHPAVGSVDVVPFTPVGAEGLGETPRLEDALLARAQFAQAAAERFDLPCFYYGPERSLPEVRRRAFLDLLPDEGPRTRRAKTGACCVGARGALVAYNLWLDADLEHARTLARRLRSPFVRALGFDLGDQSQVAINLIAPLSFGPAQAFDAIKNEARISRAELVGLIPHAVLEQVPRQRWAELGLDEETTVEGRLRTRR